MKNLITLKLIFLFIFLTPNIIIGQDIEKEDSKKAQKDWLKVINKSEDLKSFYTEQSGILLNDELFTGIENINNQLQKLIKNTGSFTDYNIIDEFQLRDNQKFELGTYTTKSGQILNTIIGWKFRTTWTKAFEVIYEKTKNFNNELDFVNKKREDWEKFSNLHRPDLIVSEVFSENGKYFNRGMQYMGKEIIGAYAYMSNASYKIKLDALKVLQINKTIVFDIGTFTSGGKGLYTLIWKKTNGQWQLLLDFNF